MELDHVLFDVAANAQIIINISRVSIQRQRMGICRLIVLDFTGCEPTVNADYIRSVIARARSQDWTLGRPRVSVRQETAIRKAHDKGFGISAIAAMVGVERDLVPLVLAAQQQGIGCRQDEAKGQKAVDVRNQI